MEHGVLAGLKQDTCKVHLVTETNITSNMEIGGVRDHDDPAATLESGCICWSIETRCRFVWSRLASRNKLARALPVTLGRYRRFGTACMAFGIATALPSSPTRLARAAAVAPRLLTTFGVTSGCSGPAACVHLPASAGGSGTGGVRPIATAGTSTLAVQAGLPRSAGSTGCCATGGGVDSGMVWDGVWNGCGNGVGGALLLLRMLRGRYDALAELGAVTCAAALHHQIDKSCSTKFTKSLRSGTIDTLQME